MSGRTFINRTDTELTIVGLREAQRVRFHMSSRGVIYGYLAPKRVISLVENYDNREIEKFIEDQTDDVTREVPDFYQRLSSEVVGVNKSNARTNITIMFRRRVVIQGEVQANGGISFQRGVGLTVLLPRAIFGYSPTPSSYTTESVLEDISVE